ncbi:MAG: phosphotransferase [Planctomycetes bacterium]|nr:phosphotransferase [Planctomycetota bacterium]
MSSTPLLDFGDLFTQYPHATRPMGGQPPVAVSGGFSGAQVWRVATHSGPMALRGTDRHAITLDRVRELHRLVEFVQNRSGVPLAVPVRSLAGESLVVHGSFVWQLEPWLPGRADVEPVVSRGRLTAAMTTLARWHLAAATFVPSAPGQAWFYSAAAQPSPGLNERLARLELWQADRSRHVRDVLEHSDWTEFRKLGRAILDSFHRLAPEVATRLKVAARIPERLQPCLRDVWRAHVLFTEDRVTGLIDLHAARTDHVATDLARLLGSFVADDREGWAAGLAAYQTVHPLSVAEQALVELFDQSAVLLSGLTWLEWACLERRQFADRETVESRLHEIWQRMRTACAQAEGRGASAIILTSH